MLKHLPISPIVLCSTSLNYHLMNGGLAGRVVKELFNEN